MLNQEHWPMLLTRNRMVCPGWGFRVGIVPEQSGAWLRLLNGEPFHE